PTTSFPLTPPADVSFHSLYYLPASFSLVSCPGTSPLRLPAARPRGNGLPSPTSLQREGCVRRSLRRARPWLLPAPEQRLPDPTACPALWKSAGARGTVSRATHRP